MSGRKNIVLFYLFLVVILVSCTYLIIFTMDDGHGELENDDLEFPKVRISSLPQKVQDSLFELEEKIESGNKFALNFDRFFADDLIPDSIPLIIKFGPSQEQSEQYITGMPEFLIGIPFSELEENMELWELEEFDQKQALVLSKITDDDSKRGAGGTDYPFYLGVSEGRVAIFEDNSNQKQLVQETELEVEQLPPEEREVLEEGLFVDSQEELFALLEGLLSYSLD